MKTIPVEWRKSSHSGPDTDCVEVRHDLTAVRDSKNTAGPTLRISVPALIAAIREGRIG